MSIIRGKPVFLYCPEDWIGKTIEIFGDGEVMLDSGLFSKERKAREDFPIATMMITSTTTQDEISSWLRAQGIYKYA